MLNLNRFAAAIEVLDGIGIHGQVLHWSMIFAIMGSAAIVFLYYWKKRLLSFDEGPKYKMLQEEEE